jgi:excisionase family DNA binding protein
LQTTNEPLAHGPDEACKLLGIGRTLFFNLLKTGEIPSLTIGGRRLVRHADLVAFLEKRLTNAA